MVNWKRKAWVLTILLAFTAGCSWGGKLEFCKRNDDCGAGKTCEHGVCVSEGGERMPPSLFWSYETGGYVASSPALGDIDNDGKLEVVIGSSDDRIYALNGEDGSLLWSYPAEISMGISSSPALGDIDGDGKLEVVIGSTDNNIYALNGEDGSLLWSYNTGNWVGSSPTLGDIDGDGKLEVVVGSFYIPSGVISGLNVSSPELYALNGEDGSLLWSYAEGLSMGVFCSPSLGDIDGDGKLEVVVGTLDNKILALNGEDGSLIWSYGTSMMVFSSPSLGDINNDGKLEVVIGVLNDILALNGEDGSILWSSNVGNGLFIISSPSLGDIDNDGKLEVVSGGAVGFNGNSSIYSLNGENGSLLWTYPVTDAVGASPSLGDIDKDGKLEVIVGTICSTCPLEEPGDHKLYALNGEDGSLLWSYAEGISPGVSSSPALGDIDGDGKLEVVVGSRDNNIYALSTNAPVPSPSLLPWPSFKHDTKNTGLYTSGPNPPW